MAATQARAGPLDGAPPGAASRPRTAHRGLAAAGLARLLEHLGDEALASVLRGAGADAEIIIAAVGHGYALCNLWRVRSCKARGHACIGAGLAPQAARRRSRCVLRHPHVQTGFRRGPVPRPFVLPSAFAPRWRSGQRRPGGAAA
ncbi:VirD2 components relaxase [Burkholderia sp. AU4i]|nr:VirD2 components relaxase [Burkholderia sp. AU4i]